MNKQDFKNKIGMPMICIYLLFSFSHFLVIMNYIIGIENEIKIIIVIMSLLLQVSASLFLLVMLLIIKKYVGVRK